MLRIVIVAQNSAETVLELAGFIGGEDVDLLARQGDALRRTTTHLVLDLHSVRQIDGNGLALLKSWHRQQVVLRRPSLYVRTLLASQGVNLPPDNPAA